MKQGLDALAALLTSYLQMTLSTVLPLAKLNNFKSSRMTSSHVLRGWLLPRFPTASKLRHWLIQPSLRLTGPNYLIRLILSNTVCVVFLQCCRENSYWTLIKMAGRITPSFSKALQNYARNIHTHARTHTYTHTHTHTHTLHAHYTYLQFQKIYPIVP